MPPLSVVALEGELESRLAAIPTVAGVGQILGPEGRSLVIGRAANLRRWARSHLGDSGRPPARGRRPRTNLRPIATAVAHVATTSAFAQRLAFERLMARHVPPSARRDLRPPAFLHLDAGERFPRLSVRSLEHGKAALFGPFRNRGAAERARDALNKRFALRPCDYTFEPHPELPLGLGCVYAQVRTCSAPCLARVSEDRYRAFAAEAVSLLSERAGRPPVVADWVTPVAGSRGVVVADGRDGVELYPVYEGAVLEEGGAFAREDALAAAVAGLRWDPPASTRHDWPWLSTWLHDPRRQGAYVVVGEAADLLNGVERALAAMRGR